MRGMPEIRKLRILHTESHCQWGGQERRVFSESQWMCRKGHHIIILTPKGTPLWENANKEGWETCHVSFDRLRMAGDCFRVRGFLRKIRPDVLNTHGNTDSKVALTAAMGLNIPCVIRSRHSTPAVRNSWYNRLLYGKLSHHVFTTANCISAQLVRDLGIPGERVLTLPSGISPRPGLPDHKDARDMLIKSLGLGSGTRFVSFVGRLSDEKGLPCLTDAFAGIRDTIPDYHLIIVGDGDMLPTLRKQVREHQLGDRVHFLGYRDNPWPYFRASDCHVLASPEYEGVPQVILQAMFAGCPVVATNAGGIPDIVVHGKTGLLVPPEDPGQLGMAILQTLGNAASSERQTERAFEYVLANHTLDVMGEKILRVYGGRVGWESDYKQRPGCARPALRDLS